MADTNQWLTLVTKLLEATQTNQISWQISDPPRHLMPSSERVAQVYETEFHGKRFRIYERMYKAWQDDVRFEWAEDVKLDFVDENGRSLYTVPISEGVHDLYSAVKYQTAEIEQFLQKF